MALTAAERQRRCREKRKQDPEKIAEVKRKDLDRYHNGRRKLVKDMTPREHRQMKRKWRARNKKRREQKASQNVLMNTPVSIPVPSSPRLLPLSPKSRSLPPISSTARARGREKVRRDRSKNDETSRQCKRITETNTKKKIKKKISLILRVPKNGSTKK